MFQFFNEEIWHFQQQLRAFFGLRLAMGDVIVGHDVPAVTIDRQQQHVDGRGASAEAGSKDVAATATSTFRGLATALGMAMGSAHSVTYMVRSKL